MSPLVILSTSVNAAFHCSVDIHKVLIYNNGIVNILHSDRNDYTNICSLNDDWKGVGVTTCAMWTSSSDGV